MHKESLHTSNRDSILSFAPTASCKHSIEYWNLLSEVLKVYSILVISNTIKPREIQKLKWKIWHFLWKYIGIVCTLPETDNLPPNTILAFIIIVSEIWKYFFHFQTTSEKSGLCNRRYKILILVNENMWF